MTVYLVYAKIKEEEYLNKLRYLIDSNKSFEYRYKNNGDGGVYIGLYAWTTDLKTLNNFMKIRNKSHYILRKNKKYSKNDSEFKRFKKEYSKFKIDEYILFGNRDLKEDPMRFTITYFEYSNSSDLFESNFLEFSLPMYVAVDYKLFKKKYQLILDKLCYSTIYEIYASPINDDTAYDERFNLASYNMSYNLSPLGNEIYFNPLINEYLLFYILFRYFFE